MVDADGANSNAISVIRLPLTGKILQNALIRQSRLSVFRQKSRRMSRPCMWTRTLNSFKLLGVYRDVTGDDAEPISLGGGTYARAFDNAVAFGILFPGEPNMCHQTNEYWSVDDLNAKICASWLKQSQLWAQNKRGGFVDKERSSFKPYISADRVMPEMTATSIILGIILAIVFIAQAQRASVLRLGLQYLPSIPAAVISMGVIRVIMKKDSILENSMVQTIGSAGRSVAAGAIFTLPALFIWANEWGTADPSLVEIAMIALAKRFSWAASL